MPIPLAALPALAVHLLPAAASGIGAMLACKRGEEAGLRLAQAVEAITGTSDPEAAREVLETHPEAARAARLELERMLADHALAMAKEETERQRIAAADMADARRMGVAMAQTPDGNRMRDFMARANVALFAGSAVGAVLAIIYHPDPLVVAACSTVTGLTGAAYKDTTSYFLGSSAGSASKDARLAAMEGRARP